jgi:hypothetical protein
MPDPIRIVGAGNIEMQCTIGAQPGRIISNMVSGVISK